MQVQLLGSRMTFGTEISTECHLKVLGTKLNYSPQYANQRVTS